MFAKLSTLALALPLVSALTLTTPTSVSSGAPLTITWTASTTDPSSFSLQFYYPGFESTYAIANNVPTVNGQVTITVPQIPAAPGYVIQAFENSDVNVIYASSGSFTVTAPSSTTTSAASTTSTATTSSSSGSVTAPTTASTTTPVTVATSALASGTSSSAVSTPSTLNSSGVPSFKLVGVAPAAALALLAVAGAAMVF